MKTSLRILPVAVVLTASALRESAPAATGVPEPQIVERGPNHRVWERQNIRALANGRTITNRSSYIEVSSGLHRATPEGGWMETSPRIDVSPDGQHGLVRHLQYQVIFAGNPATADALDISLPEGQRLTGHLLGLAYFDGPRSAMIAEPREVVGEIAGAEHNELIFRDAFSDVTVDVQYVVERGRLSQNLILRQQLPSPLAYGLTENAALAVLTEFTAFPEVVRRTRPGTGEAGALKDEHISLGPMEFAAGHALALGDGPPTRQGRMRKSWEVFADGRNCLVEQIAWKQIEPELRTLPPANADAGKRWRERRIQQQAMRGAPPSWLPDKRKARPAIGLLKTAQAAGATATGAQLSLNARPSTLHSTRGYLLDFELVTGSALVFEAHKTFYVSGPVNLSSATFRGGCVIKYANTNSAKIALTGSVNWEHGDYRPVVMTARDDHSIGETIGSSSLSGYYAAIALEVDPAAETTLKNLRISHATVGLSLHDQTFDVKHAQFIRCQTAIEGNKPTVHFGNALIYDCNKAFDLTQSDVVGEHVTFHQLSTLASTASGSSLKLTNSLLIQVTNIGSNFSAGFVQTNATAANVFDIVGAGASYLKSSSTYRNAGTANVNATLLADLKKRTTYPPIVIGDGTLFTTSLTLYPQAQRDTDTPDLGYHYDCLDYVFSALALTNATITAMPGVAIGTRTLYTYGLGLLGGARFLCEGTPANLNRIVRYNTVQEQANTSWTEYASGGANIMTAWTATSTAPHARIRFTEFSVPAGTEMYQFWGYVEDAGTHDFRDSQFHGGVFLSDRPTVGVTNGLFNRTQIALLENYDMNPIFGHCTFAGSDLQLAHAGSGTWTFQNNLFDATTNSYAEGSFTNNYNAYTTNATRLTPNGANDVRLSVTNIAYDTGWLGRFYLPTNLASHSTLFNSGSATANTLGLYHYTVVTNQTRELTSTNDLGFHYVAVNSSGQPLDSDADGVFDVFEDLDGDGVVDSSETDWNDSTDLGLRVVITRPKNGSNIP